MALPENDGRGKKILEEKSSKNGVVGSNVADSDIDSDPDHDYGMYVDGRPMSRKLRLEYNRQVDESEGFDINLDLPLGVSVVAPINPQRGCENIPRYTELSHMAIDDFNSQNNKRYEFVKNLTVTTSLAAGFWCRITFQDRDADANAAASDAVKTFQTLAWWGLMETKKLYFAGLRNNPVVKVVSELLIPMLM
ncbi:uncharacterized protein LOC107804002 [Nicotiana tabacum]|uniref:Uncharacterized protein LOC107804002 n=1 Tax=Nicotiana tabacum TaxID=4097 RepID=A0AC58UIT2_TOBAC